MTDTGDLSLSDNGDKTLLNPDESIYGDLITEIDLEEVVQEEDVEEIVETTSISDSNEKSKLLEDTNEDIVIVEEPQQCSESEPVVNETVLSTESVTYDDILTPDGDGGGGDGVSEFFTVVDDTSTKHGDEFENEMLIGDLETEGDGDLADCHHEYQSKKLFDDCEDIVEVINSEVRDPGETTTTTDENAPDGDPETEIGAEINSGFTIETDESLNRMHVMEDVEEGSDVSGALPSSPGHAEQRPDSHKSAVMEMTTTTTLDVVVVDTAEEEEEEEEEKTNSESETVIESIEVGEEEVEKVTLSENGLTTTVEDKSPPTIIQEDSEESQKDLKRNNSVEEKSSPKEKQCEELNGHKTESNKDESEIEDITSKQIESPEVVDQNEKHKQTENEEESSLSSESSQETNQTNKRKSDDNDTENASPVKKLRNETQQQYSQHDRILSEYIEATGCETVDELQSHTDQLLVEIRTLNELAKEKEREWNNIIHVKKVKEELLLRMQRKKQVLLLNSEEKNDIDWDVEQTETINNRTMSGNGGLMMVPVVSSSPSSYVDTRTKDSNSNSNARTKPRTILPKSTMITTDLNGQGECKQGRQGPILDVRSIIADYRQRHPETVPRRGRRLKSVLNPANINNDSGKSSGNVLSMTSLAFGAGSHVRHSASSADISNELGMLLTAMDSVRQDGSRSSSADSSGTGGGSDPNVSFKDVLVQLARLSQSERQELQVQAANLAAAAAAAAAAGAKPPPPPYPEVTLHPVPPATTSTVSTTQNNSLLHGILTKSQPRSETKPAATFSPTLARLLTAPERASNNAQAMYTAALNSGVSISDLLSTGKSRNEITITPIGQYGHAKHKDGEHLEEDEAEDSADRLVIDEGNELGAGGDRDRDRDRNRTANDNGSEMGDEVPQCQGCHQKSAQFVCAGCGNQWYCSRDCQVAAWDEHSEVCSG